MTEYIYDSLNFDNPIGNEIIRCRNCRYCYEGGYFKRVISHYFCDLFDGTPVTLDGYCAWGEHDD